MKAIWKKYQRYLGPAFVAFEAVMHVYLLVYLSFNWANWLVWGFTAFELSMFVYLLRSGKHSHGHPDYKEVRCGGGQVPDCKFQIKESVNLPAGDWREALRERQIAEGRICGGCGEWPEFCGGNCSEQLR